MKVKTHSAQRTSTQAHNRGSIPGVLTCGDLLPWLDGKINHITKKGRGAETSDRIQREAWPEWQLRSAYAHLLRLPERVAPADYATAWKIVAVLESLEERGEWTQNEWARLYGMLDAWRRRASGRDVKFNLAGWRKKGDGKHTPPTIKAMQGIREVLNGQDY